MKTKYIQEIKKNNRTLKLIFEFYSQLFALIIRQFSTISYLTLNVFNSSFFHNRIFQNLNSFLHP